MSKAEALAAELTERLSEYEPGITLDRGQVTLEIASEHWLAVAQLLRDDEAFAFEQAIDLCGVDYSAFGQDEWQTDSATGTGFSRGVVERATGRGARVVERYADEGKRRFAAVVHLLSYRHNHRLRLRTFATDDALPVIPSLIELWPGVDWFEREAFDLFGIVFEGHPDLRRILTDYGFVGHPFRKDFPLIGHVEMRYDPEKQRVVYQPVTIEPRVLVPKVVRHDSRYESGSSAPEETGDA
jgi:NADH-quinone oxidoreductase subunit C